MVGQTPTGQLTVRCYTHYLWKQTHPVDTFPEPAYGKFEVIQRGPLDYDAIFRLAVLSQRKVRVIGIVLAKLMQARVRVRNLPRHDSPVVDCPRDVG